jgi:hypothetical protein
VTIEKMAMRLGISEDHLEVLRKQEEAGTLRGGYVYLKDYLETRVCQSQNAEWSALMNSLRDLRKNANTLEARDELLQKLKGFVESLVKPAPPKEV